MSDIWIAVPRLEAVDVADLRKWLEELLRKSKNFKSDDALAVLSEGIEELIEHVS